jgi:hypothetical protein
MKVCEHILSQIRKTQYWLSRFREDNRIYKKHFIFSKKELIDYLETKLMVITAFTQIS